MKGYICLIIRVVTMSAAYVYLNDVYNVRFDGFLMVGLVGLVYAVTTAIEKE